MTTSAGDIVVQTMKGGQWLVQGEGCYAVVRPDGTRSIYAKKGVPASETFKTVVKAMAEWCARNPVTPSDPKSP